MQAIVEANDSELIDGLSIDEIFARAKLKQPRIQKGNLRTVLRKFREIQIDDRGKGLVVTFDDPTQSIIIVDRGLLFYRKYMTAKWPWERLAEEAKAAGTGLEPEA